MSRSSIQLGFAGFPGFSRVPARFLPGAQFGGVALFSATSGVRLGKITFPRIDILFTGH